MKQFGAAALAALLTAGTLAGCGSSAASDTPKEPAEASSDTTQTEFSVLSAMSALSGGYNDNVVLNELQSNAGISINWETMSDSIGD